MLLGAGSQKKYSCRKSFTTIALFTIVSAGVLHGSDGAAFGADNFIIGNRQLRNTFTGTLTKNQLGFIATTGSVTAALSMALGEGCAASFLLTLTLATERGWIRSKPAVLDTVSQPSNVVALRSAG